MNSPPPPPNPDDPTPPYQPRRYAESAPGWTEAAPPTAEQYPAPADSSSHPTALIPADTTPTYAFDPQTGAYTPQPGQPPGDQWAVPTTPKWAAPAGAPSYQRNYSDYAVPTPGTAAYRGTPGMVVPPGYAPSTRTPRRSFGVVGTIIALIGAALVAASFTALTWLSAENSTGSTIKFTFMDLHRVAQSTDGGAGSVTKAYFGWLGWALLAAVVLFAILGNLAIRTHPLWRGLGLLSGFGAVAVTFAVVKTGTSLSVIVKLAGSGFWLALLGFFLTGVGAAVGPRRVRS